MYQRFYTGSKTSGNAQKFAESVLSYKRPVSPAQIQGYFMLNKMETQETVLQNVKLIWSDTTSAAVHNEQPTPLILEKSNELSSPVLDINKW